MKKDKLLASSDSLDKMIRLVNDYFYSASYILKRTLEPDFKYYVLRRGFRNGERYYFYMREVQT